MKNTNKLLVVILAFAIAVSSIAVTALTTSAAEGNAINAIVHKPVVANGNYVDVIGEDSYGAQASLGENVKKFDATIDELLAKSFLHSKNENVTDVVAGSQDNYVMKWTGTMTAAEAGEYTLIGRKIDNGFVMFVDGEKVYEYWGASHWFDGAEDRVVSDLGSFNVVAGESYDVEIYFLEIGGGDALEIWATTTPEDTNSGANMNDVFDFALTQEYYWLADGGHWADYTNDVLVGSPTGEGNGVQCSEETALYDESIDKLLDAFTNVTESQVVESFSAPIEAYEADTAYVITYEGWLVPKTSGVYTFGTTKLDNGFYMNINGTTVYECWIGRRWNDDGSGNTYGSSIELMAGTAYYVSAAFLETNGGQGLEVVATAKGGEKANVNDLFTFYAEDPGVYPTFVMNPIFTTEEIAAGSEIAYQMNNAEGYTVTIENADAFVFHNGTVYNAVDGKVTVELSCVPGMRGPVANFTIGNKATDAKAFDVVITPPVGNVDNPEVIEAGDYTASIAENSQYYYSWTAPADGTVVITVNDTDGWQYVVNNMTAGTYGDNYASDADPVVPCEVTVAANDELQIIMSTYDPETWWASPAGEINWTLTFTADASNATVAELTGDKATGGWDGGLNREYDGTKLQLNNNSGDTYLGEFTNLKAGVYKVAYYFDIEGLDTNARNFIATPKVNGTIGCKPEFVFSMKDIFNQLDTLNSKGKCVLVTVVKVPEGAGIEAYMWMSEGIKGTLDKVALYDGSYDFINETEYTWLIEKGAPDGQQSGNKDDITAAAEEWTPSTRKATEEPVVTPTPTQPSEDEIPSLEDTENTILDNVVEDVVELDGTAGIEIDSSAIAGVKDQLVIEMVIKPEEIAEHLTIMSIGDASDKPYVVIGMRGDGSYKLNEFQGAANTIKVGEWVTLKYVIGTDASQIYVNGELYAEGNGVDLANLEGAIKFGQATVAGFNDPSFKGSVAELRISTVEVADDSNNNGNNDSNNGGNNGGSTAKPVTGDVTMIGAILAAGVAALGGLKLKKKSK